MKVKFGEEYYFKKGKNAVDFALNNFSKNTVAIMSTAGKKKSFYIVKFQLRENN
jgi:hypothetical protein